MLLVFFLIILLASITRLKGFLYLAILVYPMQWLQNVMLPDLGMGITLTELIFVPMVLVYIPGMLLSRKLKRPPLNIVFLFSLFVLFQITSMVLTQNYEPGIRKIGRVLLMGLVYLTLTSGLKTRDLPGLIRIMLISFAITCLIGLGQAVLSSIGLTTYSYTLGFPLG